MALKQTSPRPLKDLWPLLVIGLIIGAVAVGERLAQAEGPTITKGGLEVDDNELGRLNQ